MYGQFAGILLQLNRLSLPRIGSMECLEEFSYEVDNRPLSLHMDELVRLGTLPRSALPDSTFSISSSYSDNLAELHMEHLKHQHDDAVESATDYRHKYVPRQLFRRLAKNRRLSASSVSMGA